MARLTKMNKDGVTLPTWALSFVLLLLGWGVTQELRIGRVEDRLAASVLRIDGVVGDHDRLVAIEARLMTLLEAQERLVDLLSPRLTRAPTPTATPPPTPPPMPTGATRDSFDTDGPADP